MNVLLLNQCFYPDVVSTAQHLTDLAVELDRQDHRVKVISGRRGYDDPSQVFASRETYRGINIRRISTINIGKQARWRRALNFAGFLINCAISLLFTPRQDAVVALTSPPLISFLGALFVKLKGGRFYFWAMDLNPDEAIAAGWLKENSTTARVLQSLLNYSMRHADKIFVLDRFMKDRVVAKNISAEKVMVVAPWSHDAAIHFDAEGRKTFRAAHNLTDKFVVMYSGNHSPCHPLDTLLNAADRLRDDEGITFCFVGGGSEKEKVERFATGRKLENILCLPYEPLTRVSASLSAADLHVVVMGDSFVGIVHPCKLYNILRVGSPVLYLGPAESHVAEVLATSSLQHYSVRHGDVDSLIRQIEEAARRVRSNQREIPSLAEQFSATKLLPKMTAALVCESKIELNASISQTVSQY